MQSLARYVLVVALGFATVALNAQFEWAQVSIVCPCSLESEDGETATLEFGLQNLENHPTENLYATIAVTGTFDDEEYSQETSLFLGTTPLSFGLSELEEVATSTYEIEFGQLPAGTVYLELLIHEGRRPSLAGLLDAIWFEGETEMPFTSLSKLDMNFLKDSDGDGVDDINEGFMNTDPNDPEDFPDEPEIDVLVVYESAIQDVLPGDDASVQISHIFAVTEFLFERSGASLDFRVVGTLDETEVPEIEDDSFFFLLPEELRDELQEQYGADLVVGFHPNPDFLCGIAEDIGGWRGRGFIHPSNKAILTHVWLDFSTCPVNVTAHEIGHLMGMGHSYVQGSVGTYYWSRGHGEHNEFGTIMSYADTAYNGIDIDKFSNPDEDCNGKPCGISHELSNHERSSDSVLTANITKYQVAANGSPPSDLDVDGDGHAADTDEFPLDSTEWVDTDGDGYGDNGDEFPNLASEWADTDGDGIGDNTDPDIDDDGVLNQHDADAFDPEISAIKILNVVSGYHNDGLGTQIVRTGDWDNGLDDIAISAPRTTDEDGEAIGAVYLVSIDELARDPLSDEQQVSRRDIGQLIAEEHAWAIHGTGGVGEIGSHMAFLSAPEDSGASGNLLISSERSVYLIQMDDANLRAFDGLDGEEDRHLSLEFCEDSPGCLFVGDNDDFIVRGIVSMHDRDDDGISDFAVLGTRQEAADVSLYLLTWAAVLSYDPGDKEVDSTFDAIVADFDSAFRIYLDTTRNTLSLKNLGNLTGAVGDELGIGIGSGLGRSDGTVYILNAEQVFLTDMNDGSVDGQVHLDDFPSGDGGSYKITMSPSNAFGHGMDSVTDVEGDERPEVLMWTQFGPHVLLSTEGLKNTDERDGSPDGIILLNDSSHEYSGAWFFDNIQTFDEASQTVLNPATEDQNSYFLVQYRDGVLLAELDDLGNLDDPEEGWRDGQIDFRSLLDRPGTFGLRVPRGLRPGTSYSGMSPLGDLDDGALDFIFAAHTTQADRQSTSSVHVLFSRSFPTIDRSDGTEDGVLRLHNNLDDTDDDGFANLHDMDDDGDGAIDLYDAFPLHGNAIYDADGDGTANVIDAFPDYRFEDSDLDGDGLGDREDSDRDGDGIENSDDEFPLDTDNDGINNYEDLDDDNDGVEDALDAFPLDADEQYDTDGDGYGDGVDLFVDDENEWEDFDQDGIGDNGDLDDDNDGYEDEVDSFPFNPDEWLDSDGDGIGDNADLFPNNPFEWEDTDDDGLGDNLGTAGIAIHRIESEWRDYSFFNSQDTTGHYVWDFGSTDGHGLLIQGGNPSDPRGALHLLSSNDLSQLDSLDQQTNQSIDVVEIANGSQSWEFRGPRSSELNYENYGALTDIDGDSISDLVIGSRNEESGKGAVFIVFGSQLAHADSIDGLSDGKINHTQCSFIGTCVAIFNSTSSLFGSSATSLNGFFGEGTSAVAIANFFTSERPLEGEEGMPVIHLLSSTAISNEVEELQDSDLDLDRLQEREGTYQIYPETDEDVPSPLGVIAHQVSDYDNDNAEDLIIVSLFANSTYILASSDIPEADSIDEAEDGLIDLTTILSRPNSYKLDGFTPTLTSSRTTAWGSSSNARQFVPMFGGNEGEHYLLDISELDIHVDPEEEGIIDGIDLTDTNSWELVDIGDLQVCNGGMDLPDTRVVGHAGSFGDRSFYWFTLSQMRNYAEDSETTRNVVDIPEAFESGTSGFWSIGLGSLNNQLDSLQVACVGDWDNDGEEDLAVSILQTRGFFDEAKATVFLLMTGDLPALDRLDGETNNEVDLSLLWRTASDELE